MPILNEITIEVGKDKVRARSQRGAAREGRVHLDQLRLATIQVFEELLLLDAIQTRRHMEVLGQHLYEGIFDTNVDQLLNEKLKEVQKDRLRLQLQFESDVDPKIASLPWEFLYSPARQDFLATDVNLVLSRYMELGRDREGFEKAERPLRALVIVSRPSEERAVMSNDVINKIKSLNIEGQEKTIHLKVVDPPTLENIQAALEEHKPHIFHFIGHGKYDRATKTGCLLLVNLDTGESEQCDDSTLIDRFRSSQCFPRLVFLHMCEGGIVDKNATVLQAFSGFAPKLIHAKISSVVAMQYPIKNEDARDFSLAFYSTLAAGGSVDEAVQEGRSKLDLYRRSRLFGTPALYMHSAEGLVLPKKITSKSSNPSGDQYSQQGLRRSISSSPSSMASTAGSAPQRTPAERAMLDQLINKAVEEAKSIPSVPRMKVIQRLFTMRDDLANRDSADIFNVFFETWEQEADPDVKKVWERIIRELSV